MSVWDYKDGDFIFDNGDYGIKSDGSLMWRISDYMAMDIKTREIHPVSFWEDEDDYVRLWDDED